MIELVDQLEAQPEDWPTVWGCIDPVPAWQRVEHYIAHRFAPREVTWLLEAAGGVWIPPLCPVVSITARRWTGGAYEPLTLSRVPRGWHVPAGSFEIVATVGAGPVPPVVEEAVRRLAAYLDEETGVPAGARSYSMTTGQLSERIDIGIGHEGRALQNSGAADLLRAYRRPRHAVA